MADSSTGGYLAPLVVTPPSEDDALDAQLQAAVVGITGLDGTLVRPRWQVVPPKQPETNINWCAIGVLNIVPDDNAAIIHHPAGNGSDEMQRHEQIDVLASFYGPSAWQYAMVLRDGLFVPQNREALFFNSMALLDVGRAVSLPELVSQQWLRRVDLPITFRRIVTRTYQILNLLSADGVIHLDEGEDETFHAGP